MKQINEFLSLSFTQQIFISIYLVANLGMNRIF